MGMMDKFLNAMRLNTDIDDLEDDYYDDIDDEDDAYFDEEPKKPLFGGRKEKPVKEPKIQVEEEPAPKPVKEPKETRSFQPKSQPVSSSKVTPMRSTRRQTSGAPSMAVCVIKPASVDEAREITDTLLLGKTVVLNLEGLDLEVAQRIIDFTSGSCYAIEGNLQKISHYIFIVTPANVDISGDFLNLLDSSLQSDI